MQPSNPKNQTGRRSLDRLANDSRIVEIWDEAEDGYWASLAPGWNYDGCSCIHERTCAELIAAMAIVKRGESY